MATAATPVSHSEECSLGHEHRPRPRYVEHHHVIPQAWQHFWHAPSIRLVGLSTPGVWDPRTVALCRTSHGNVHDLLVALMRASAGGGIPAMGPHVNQHELAIAKLALGRWEEWGGSLADLADAGLWGEI